MYSKTVTRKTANEFVKIWWASNLSRKGKLQTILDYALQEFPDTHETIEGIIAEGDKVCIHLKGTGAHRRISWLSPYLQEDEMGIYVIWRIVTGKIVEMLTAVSDEFDFLKQLGLIVPTEKGKKFFPEDAT